MPPSIAAKLANLGTDDTIVDNPAAKSGTETDTAPNSGATGGATPAPQLTASDISSAVSVAMATAHARMNAVTSSAEYLGREAQANAFLSDERMANYTAEDIIGLLATAPKPEASATDADAADDTNANSGDTLVFDSAGKPVMDANGKQMVIKAEADADIPVFDSNGKPVTDKEGNQMTIKASTKTDNLVFDSNGKPVMGANGKQMTIPTQEHAGSTAHSFDAIMNKDEPVGADGGKSASGFSSAALNGLDDKQTADVITLLSAAKVSMGVDNMNKEPDGEPNSYNAIPALNATDELLDIHGRPLALGIKIS